MWKIYKVTNQISHWVYVGQTTQSLELRFVGHCCAKSLLGLDIQTYGKGNFIIELIEEVETKEKANYQEQFWIGKLDCFYPNGYNIRNAPKPKGKSRILANTRYRDKAYDVISFAVKKGKREEYKQAAAERGLSLASFLKNGVEEYIQRHEPIEAVKEIAA